MRIDQNRLAFCITDDSDATVPMKFGKIGFKLGSEIGIFNIVNSTYKTSPVMAISCRRLLLLLKKSRMLGCEFLSIGFFIPICSDCRSRDDDNADHYSLPSGVNFHYYEAVFDQNQHKNTKYRS